MHLVVPSISFRHLPLLRTPGHHAWGSHHAPIPQGAKPAPTRDESRTRDETALWGASLRGARLHPPSIATNLRVAGTTLLYSHDTSRISLRFPAFPPPPLLSYCTYSDRVVLWSSSLFMVNVECSLIHALILCALDRRHPLTWSCCVVY
jgi:hypothetical protein